MKDISFISSTRESWIKCLEFFLKSWGVELEQKLDFNWLVTPFINQ